MYEIGRVCMKIAGRDAGNYCVIVDILEGKNVLIDGNVRRRKCNIMHLEPTNKSIKIAKKANHEAVANEFGKLELGVWQTKPRKVGDKPKQLRNKAKTAQKKIVKKKAAKKETMPVEKKAEEKPKVEKKAPAKEKPAVKKE